MAFEIAAGIVPPAIVLRFELEHDLGAFRLGAGVRAIGVGDDHIEFEGAATRWPYSVSTSPSMIMPLPT
jgi:hypothetical protein